MNKTIVDLIEAQRQDLPAITAPGLAPMSYGELHRLITCTMQTLNDLTIGRGDRVALALPNGPQSAAAFLAIASSAVAVPLNPASTRTEIQYFLESSGARTLVLPKDQNSDAREVAFQLGVGVVELEADHKTSGRYSLVASTMQSKAEVRSGFSASGDTVLLLHTSGTTGKPKSVPLTQNSLVASAKNIADTLQLNASDTCINLMPLFHVHGLVGAVLASISAGGAVACTPGLDPIRLISWFEELKPTWITAVPTILHAIMMIAKRNPELGVNSTLRFIRSSSSPLPHRLMDELERTFRVPVVEAYGMTEAAHQIASNPLPPAARVRGSVGKATGTEVAVFDEDGIQLPSCRQGAIGIKGPNIIEAYENASEANRKDFQQGWFMTGDLGHIDANGYIHLTGRLKEIINRGGAKIAPLEVDNAIHSHHAIAEAVTFSVPDEFLGEEVAAAIVLNDGSETNEEELVDYLAQILSPEKVPTRFLFLTEIPKGKTGKVVRSELALCLGLTSKEDSKAVSFQVRPSQV